MTSWGTLWSDQNTTSLFASGAIVADELPTYIAYLRIPKAMKLAKFKSYWVDSQLATILSLPVAV